VPESPFLPVTDEVIRRHLSGYDELGRSFTIGLYPMLMDETCFFLAIDLDGPGWEEDARALAETCRRLALSFAWNDPAQARAVICGSSLLSNPGEYR